MCCVLTPCVCRIVLNYLTLHYIIVTNVLNIYTPLYVLYNSEQFNPFCFVIVNHGVCCVLTPSVCRIILELFNPPFHNCYQRVEYLPLYVCYIILNNLTPSVL